MGSAIDEAAQHEKHADGGLVCLAESAERVVTEARAQWGEHTGLEALLINDYRVPDKTGGFYTTSVVSPFGYVLVDPDGFLRRVEATFTPDVERKRDNTMAFLRYARDAKDWSALRRGE